MHDVLRERIWRHLEALPEERLYQVADYIEFLSSKYARGQVRPPSSSFQKFGERLEDKLRGNRVGMDAIRGTLQAVGTADRMVSGLAEMGRSLIREVSGPEESPTGARPALRPQASRDAEPRPEPRSDPRPEDIPVDG